MAMVNILPNRMNITIFHGKRMDTVLVASSSPLTVSNLMESIENRLSLPREKQVLIFRHQPIHETPIATFSELKMENDAIVVMGSMDDRNGRMVCKCGYCLLENRDRIEFFE
ncbi:hypothetical protein ACOME3_000279 [Neoechinorhynchus agilis]